MILTLRNHAVLITHPVNYGIQNATCGNFHVQSVTLKGCNVTSARIASISLLCKLRVLCKILKRDSVLPEASGEVRGHRRAKGRAELTSFPSAVASFSGAALEQVRRPLHDR